MYSLSHVVPAAMIELLRSTPLTDGKVGFAWKAAVGPAVDRAARVRLEGTTLVVETSSAQWAQEIRRASAIILPRLQQFLGSDAVTALTVRSHA